MEPVNFFDRLEMANLSASYSNSLSLEIIFNSPLFELGSCENSNYINPFTAQDINMESKSIGGLQLYYDLEESDVVDDIAFACDRSVQTISKAWQLETPGDCRVYILSSWPRCVFLGAPFRSQLMLGLTIPLWYIEFKKRWLYSGGWSQGYGERQVVGIKSPRLIAEIPEPLGESIFIKEDDLNQKVLSIVCHELTHACSSHLQLPTWLNEGLAMVSAEKCLGKPTILQDTLQLLNRGDINEGTTGELKLKSQTRDEVIHLYVCAYWLTRYLADNYPDLVTALLKEKLGQHKIEALIASVLEIPQERFWRELSRRVYQSYNFELT